MRKKQRLKHSGGINDKPVWEGVFGRLSLNKLWKKLAVIAIAIVLTTCILTTYGEDQNRTVSVESDEIFCAPNIVFLSKKYYVDSGHWVYSLPADAVLLGEVNNVCGINSDELVEDLDGTRDGRVYMIPEESDTIYFQHKVWDNSVDGREKYIILICEKEK